MGADMEPSPLTIERPDDTETKAAATSRWPSPLIRLGRRIRDAPLEAWVSLGLVSLCCGFVFAQLHPSLLFTDTTPAGGDMGAHVWGPAYLRDELLPSGRLTGWSGDWYAGFPAYQFYMVVPALAVVVLDLILPYGVAFKLVTVSGAVLMPLAAWAFGRLTRAPFPGPALFAVATTVFLFDRSYSIYGGNIASTLAGEFSFTMSLALAILYLGLVARGLETGRHRGWAALVLALCGLCHLIPAFFAVGGTFLWFAIYASRDLARTRAMPYLPQAFIGAGMVALGILTAMVVSPTAARLSVAAMVVALVGGTLYQARDLAPWRAFYRLIRRRLWWLATMAPVAGLLAAFWVLPFYGRQNYLNDMGWVKESRILDYLVFRDEIVGGGIKDAPELTWVLALAVVGALVSIGFRQKVGVFLLGVAVLTGVAFVYTPQGRLWNTRLLPFYYLSLYLLAAVALTQAPRLLRARTPRRAAAGVAALSALVLQAAIINRWAWQPPGFAEPIVFDDRFLPFLMVSVGLVAAVLAVEVMVLPAALRARAGLLTLGMAVVTQVLMTLETSVREDDRLLPWFFTFVLVAVAAGLAQLLDADERRRRQLTTAAVSVAVATLALSLLGPVGWGAGTGLLPYFYGALFLVSVSAVLEIRASFLAPEPIPVPAGAPTDGDPPDRGAGPGWDAEETADAPTSAAPELLIAPEAPPVGRDVLVRAAKIGLAVTASLAALLVVLLPLHPWPGDTADGGEFRLGPFSTTDASFVDGWAAWNYRGYEAPCDPGESCSGNGYKPYYPEYEAVVRTMAEIGDDPEHGCGRAMWEYSSDLNDYGTPMALMLLPYWTDGCIGSMEGLYFEASTTTPYHFLNQDQLSASGSNAQRGLPYAGVTTERDFDLGVAHLQMFGVRYYLAHTPEMIEFAEEHPDLTEIASSPGQCREGLCPQGVDPERRWVVFEVADSPLVEPLQNEPVVLTGVERGHTCEAVDVEEDSRGRSCEGWLDPAVDWYQDESLWPVPLAEDGPEDWERIDVDDWLESHEAPAAPVDPVTVSAVDVEEDRISFEVSEPGTPVLVKASYFPNWVASGADGPYRVTPNLMVVVPTETRVELSYGWTTLDRAAYALSLLGIVFLVLLFRRPPVELPAAEELRREAEAEISASLVAGSGAGWGQASPTGDDDAGGDAEPGSGSVGSAG